MKMHLITRAIGAPLDRLDGVQKVTGAAKYAYEYPVEDVTYVFPVQSTIARGRVTSIDASAAQALPGVITVLSHENAPRLAPLENGLPFGLALTSQYLAVFQSDAVSYRGQFVAAVVAETLEMARQAASLVVVRYEEQPHEVELRVDRADLYTPELFIPGGSLTRRAGMSRPRSLRLPSRSTHIYTTPAEHNNPLEPHTTTAIWGDEDSVTLYDSNQGPHVVRDAVASAFRLPPEQVRVIATLCRRRIRLQGVHAPACDPRRHGRAGGETARQARAHPPADVRAGRAIARRPSSACEWGPSAMGGSRRSRTMSLSRPRPSTSMPSRPPPRRG